MNLSEQKCEEIGTGEEDRRRVESEAKNRESESQGTKNEASHGQDNGEEEKASFFEKTLGMGWTLGSLVKKSIKGSLNSLFMSEEGLSQSLSEMALPKEISAFIMQYAEGSKKEFTRLISKEIKQFLESANFYSELRKFLSTVELEISANIKFNERLPKKEELTAEESGEESAETIEPKISQVQLGLTKRKDL